MIARTPKHALKPLKDLSEPLEDALPPANLAALLEADADPLTTLAEVAREAGLPQAQAEALIARVRGQYQPVMRELRKVKTSGLVAKIEDRLDAALDRMTDEKLDAASAKDTAIVIGILLEKRQLLRGEPTAILSVEERRAMNDLIPELVKEAKRRGMEFEIRGPIVDVTPRPEGRAAGLAVSRGKEMALAAERKAQDELGEPD